MSHNVSQYLIMSHSHYKRDTIMSQNVLKCLKASHTISQCLIMSDNVSQCLKMSDNVSQCLKMSHNVANVS